MWKQSCSQLLPGKTAIANFIEAGILSDESGGQDRGSTIAGEGGATGATHGREADDASQPALGGGGGGGGGGPPETVTVTASLSALALEDAPQLFVARTSKRSVPP